MHLHRKAGYAQRQMYIMLQLIWHLLHLRQPDPLLPEKAVYACRGASHSIRPLQSWLLLQSISAAFLTSCLPSSHYSVADGRQGMDGFHSIPELALVWSFKVILSRSIRPHWCIDRKTWCDYAGGWTAPLLGQAGSLISVPKSDTRCQ